MKHILAGILLLTTSFAYAQDVPEERNMFISGGVLCNTELELQTLLTGISIKQGQWPEDIPEGCGRFVPEAPLPATATPLYWYETPMVNTLVARFHFPLGDWTQYGWLGYIPNPDYEAPAEDEGA